MATIRQLAATAAALMTLTAGTATAETTHNPQWLRDVAISPDGQRIAFTYKGDIWTVPTAGGRATRLTATPGVIEQMPVWSPDSRRIAFAGNSFGGADVMIVDAEGGAPERLTSLAAFELPMAFTPDGSEVIYQAAIQDAPESRLFPISKLKEVYAVAADGSGKNRRIVSFAADRLIPAGNDGSFLYNNVNGYENEWRKHHTSSAARDIYRYDASTKTATNLTRHAGEDRDPALSADGSTLYFLSERNGGAMNVWAMPANGTGTPRQLTDFEAHPVRFLTISPATGTLAMAWDGDIYTLTPGEKPAKVNISLIDTDDSRRPRSQKFSNSSTEIYPSPDGKQLAWVYRGDVFVGSTEYETSRQVTATPAREYSLSWGKDGKELYYTSERNGRHEIWKAAPARSADPDFANATLITQTQVLALPDVDVENPRISPDGKKMAYISDRNRIMVMDLATGEKKELADGTQYPQRDGGFEIVWSPDSRHLAAEIMTRRHDPYSDIAIYDTVTGERTSITDSGYFDMHPVWTMNGEAILYLSERYGMRNHASWGSMFDVMITFLTREAYDRYRMSKEEYAFYKDAKDKAAKAKKDAEDKDSKKDKKKKGKKADDKSAKKAEPEKSIKIDPDAAELYTVRLTPFSADISDMIITGADGEELLWYVAANQDGYDLWKINLREGDTERARSLSDRAGFDRTADGKTVYLGGKRLNKMNTTSGALTPIAYSGTLEYTPADEYQAMLDYVRNEERERFYVKDMHGVEWDSLVTHYNRFLPYINNNHDYSELLSELLGELNVSHTGSGYRTAPANKADSSLGLLYDFDAPGVVVAEVNPAGPFGVASSKMTVGANITAINGKPVADPFEVYTALAGAKGKNTLVSFTLPGGATVEESVKPVSLGDDDTWAYRRWVKRNEQLVDSLSGGRLGYVHISSMSDPSFRALYSKALGKYNDRDGLVIDIRWNSGGRLHEDIEVFLSGKKYFTQEVRGVASCDMPSRRVNKPTIMLVNEACYSNAHGTPWVYQHQKLGKVVGAPIAGTMTSVNWVTLQDPSMYFGIPVVGYRTADGTFTENSQLVPDVVVINNDAATAAGSDVQLETAVRELLNDLDK